MLQGENQWVLTLSSRESLAKRILESIEEPITRVSKKIELGSEKKSGEDGSLRLGALGLIFENLLGRLPENSSFEDVPENIEQAFMFRDTYSIPENEGVLFCPRRKVA